MGTAKADVLTSEGKLDEAKSDYQQALDEYNTKKTLYDAQSERCHTARHRETANAGGGTARRRRCRECHQTVGRDAPCGRPAGAEGEREAALAAQVELDRMTIRAGVDGRVDQFVLRPGDIVSRAGHPGGGNSDPGCRGRRVAVRRIQPDRSPGDQGRHVGGGNLHLQAHDHYSAGRLKRPGRHRRRPDLADQSADRHGEARCPGHGPGYSRASLQGRT